MIGKALPSDALGGTTAESSAGDVADHHHYLEDHQRPWRGDDCDNRLGRLLVRGRFREVFQGNVRSVAWRFQSK